MRPDKKLIKYLFLCILGGILFYWLLLETDQAMKVWRFVSGIFAPFAIGAALAFVLNVPMRAIERGLDFIRAEKPRRAVAVVVTFLLVALAIYGVVMLLIPQINKTIADIVGQLPGFFSQIGEKINQLFTEKPEIKQWLDENFGLLNFDFSSINWQNLIEKAVDLLTKSLSSVFNGAISVVGTVSSVIFNMVISLVFSVYCLLQKDTLSRQGRKLLYALVPEHFADETVRILRMTNSAFSNFITGQGLEAVILALLFVIGMMLFRMPYIPLICVLIGVTALVPLVGAFIGCVLGAFFILVNDPLQAVTFVIMFLVIQQFENNVIYPRVVGSSIGLPGMWVLLAVTVGGEVMGVGGMLIMVPFASVLYTLLGEFTRDRLAARQIDPDKLTPCPPELQSHFMMKRRKKKASVPPQQPEAEEQPAGE